MIPQRRFSRNCVWGALVLLACVGCASAPKALTADQRAAIRQRAETQFSNAALLKPCEPASTNTLSHALSPLLIQEIADDTGYLTNSPPLVVLSAENEVLIAGKRHQQVSFVWNHRVEGDRGQPTTDAWQGVRITLNTDGLPAIWEVLQDSSGARVMFVAQSVEIEALREFGPPVPGTRFSVERAAAESPDTIVARIIDDAPLPMGPIVHVNACGEVMTVNCRCMPTQARRLVAQGQYGLVADPVAAAVWLEKTWWSKDNGGLERALRLPAGL